VLQQNITGKVIRHDSKLPTVLLFVELNTAVALAILTEQRDFVGAGVGQSCGYETAQGDRHWDYSLLV
jgi:hypothetical protein